MEKPELTFTIDEIEGLLASLQRDPQLVGFTTREVAEAAGKSMSVTRERYIRPLVRAGLAIPATISRKPELSEYWTRVQGYQFVQEGES